MADLLFADLRHPRRPRQFKPPINIENFTDEEVRNLFRFGRQGNGYITNLIADELHRSTRRNHALPPLQQVVIALRFCASGRFLQVIGDTAGDSRVCLLHLEPECYKRDLKAELLGLTSTQRNLKPDAVPTIFDHRPKKKPRLSSERHLQERSK